MCSTVVWRIYRRCRHTPAGDDENTGHERKSDTATEVTLTVSLLTVQQLQARCICSAKVISLVSLLFPCDTGEDAMSSMRPLCGDSDIPTGLCRAPLVLAVILQATNHPQLPHAVLDNRGHCRLLRALL